MPPASIRDIHTLSAALLLLASHSIPASAAQDEVIPPVEVRDWSQSIQATKSVGKPLPDACDSGNPVDCRHPFDAYCAQVRENAPSEDISRMGHALVQTALRDALHATPEHGAFGAISADLASLHLPTRPGRPSPTGQERFESALVDLWTQPAGIPQTEVSAIDDALVPSELQACNGKGTPPFPNYAEEPRGSGASRELDRAIRGIRSARSELTNLSSRILRAQEPLDLYQRLLKRCALLAAEPPDPPFCQPDSLRRLKREVVDEFSRRKSAHPADGDALKSELSADLLSPPASSAPLLQKDPDVVPSARKFILYQWLANEYHGYCNAFAADYHDALYSRLFDYRDHLARSEPAVRSLEKAFFDPGRLRIARKIFDERKEAVRSLFETEIGPAAGLDPGSIGKLARSMDQLRLLQPSPVPDQAFQREEGFPLPVLPEVLPIAPGARFDPAWPYLDGTLAGFSSLNSGYLPASMTGIDRYNDTVWMDPELYLFLPGNEDALEYLLGHEIAHKFGPYVSYNLGVDLRPAYAKLLACFERGFNMQPRQIDESIADWSSYHLNARRIAKLPAPERQAAISKLVRPGCLSSLEIGARLEDPHPSPMIRLNGIAGSDPLFRQLLGCPATPACTLRGSDPPPKGTQP